MVSMAVGIVSYDVPMHRKSVYSKIRSPIRGYTMMLSWSCYLFPWGHKDVLEKAITRANFDKDGNALPQKDRVRYSIAKFDGSDPQALQDMITQSYDNMLANIKESFRKSLEKADERGAEDDAKNDILKRARRHLKEMESLALIFALTDNYSIALAAFSNQIQAQSDLIKAKDAKEEEEEVEEEIEVEEEVV